jgi:hypothetical protein
MGPFEPPGGSESGPTWPRRRQHNARVTTLFPIWKGDTPEEFKQWMLTHAEGYEDITYQSAAFMQDDGAEGAPLLAPLA